MNYSTHFAIQPEQQLGGSDSHSRVVCLGAETERVYDVYDDDMWQLSLLLPALISRTLRRRVIWVLVLQSNCQNLLG